MSDPFYSDELEAISRKLPTPQTDITVDINITDRDLHRCVEWINNHNATKVALQFNDYILEKVTDVVLKLKNLADKEYFILVDSQCARVYDKIVPKSSTRTLGVKYMNSEEQRTTRTKSCCVDEIAADHGDVDVIIHFGPACLAATTGRYPVLYIFGEVDIDISAVTAAFKKHFPDITDHIVICYDVYYQHAVDQISEALKEYENLVISKLDIPHEKLTEFDDDLREISLCARSFILPRDKVLDEYSVFYIGSGSPTLSHTKIILDRCKFYVYDSVTNTVETPEQTRKQFLMKRNYSIEKVKDAKRIGILVNTLGVSGYLSAISKYRQMIQEAGKKSYTLAVGKTNVAKLANFADIEVFVNISCAETTIIDSKEFLQPIITPQELEIALHGREWSDKVYTDINDLLPEEKIPCDKSDLVIEEGDISLITGNLRSMSFNSSAYSDDTDDESHTALVKKKEMVLAKLHENGAGEVLSNRHWKGLEQQLGATLPAEVQQGRKGIACEYEDEREQSGS